MEVTEQEIKDLKRIRNYFGENDRTYFEHFAFDVINKIIKRHENKE